MNPLRQNLCAALRRAALSVVWICVLANLWRAPMVWIHVHSPGDAPDSVAANLAEHVTGFHRSNVRPDEDAWHIHLALLDDIVRGGGDPIPSDEQDVPVLPSSVCPLPHTNSFQAEATTRERLSYDCPSIDRPALTRHAADNCELLLGSALRPPNLVAVLCVARC